MVSTGQKLAYLFPNANIVIDWLVVNDGSGEVITYFNPALGAQPSQATLDEITEVQVLTAIATRAAQAAKAAATSGIDNGDAVAGDKVERLARAVAAVALDAFNRDRECMDAMRAAVAAATTLADLKTRFAAISWPATVTAPQLVTAIKAKIAASAE